MFALVRSFLLSPSFLLQSIVLLSFDTIYLHATRPVSFPLYSIASFMVPVVYPVGYPVIYPIIRTIFAKESGVECLKTRAYLLNHLYKIRVILAVRV